MPVTFDANYQTVFSKETVEKIHRLEADLFDRQGMIEFIDKHGEDSFADYYEQYVELGEEYDYIAVNYFINELDSIDDLDGFDKAYVGWYREPRDFAEAWFESEARRLSYMIVVDWEETAAMLLDDSDIMVKEIEHGAHYFRRHW